MRTGGIKPATELMIIATNAIKYHIHKTLISWKLMVCGEHCECDSLDQWLQKYEMHNNQDMHLYTLVIVSKVWSPSRKNVQDGALENDWQIW